MGGRSSKSLDSSTLSRLDGKVVIVTGGSGGLGKGIIRHLARLGAKVYMAVRDEPQTTEALAELKQDGFPDIHVLELDLVNPRFAKQAAERFMQMENRLDILVNNAALLNDHGRAGLNVDGLGESMATNVLGPFVFTNTLLPLLRATSTEPDSDVRIVNVGSDGHTYVHDPKFATLEDWNQTFSHKPLPSQSRYLFSKMGVHLWSNALVRHISSERDNKIIVMISHPGAVFSDGTKQALRTLYLSSLWIYIASYLMDPPDIAAHSTVFAAAASEVKDHPDKYHGAYIKPPNVIGEQSGVALDLVRQDQVWGFLSEFLGKIGM